MPRKSVGKRKRSEKEEESNEVKKEENGDQKDSKSKKSKKSDSIEEKQRSTILERGHIYFFYRPKIDSQKVEDQDDVQRLLLVLSPTSEAVKTPGKPATQEESLKRVFLLGKKSLPSTRNHEKFWGAVDVVTKSFDELQKTLGPRNYETKTKGDRHLQACRPCGAGYYALVEHHEHTHIAFVLEQPEKLGEVQKAFKIPKEGSYIVTVKNPNIDSNWTNWLTSKGEPKFPKELQGSFAGKRQAQTKWHPVNPPQLMDYPGAVLLFIGASDDLVQEFGQTGKKLEQYQQVDVLKLDDNKLFEELRISKHDFPAKPLLEGKWE